MRVAQFVAALIAATIFVSIRPVRADVNLEWRPTYRAASHNQLVDISLYAVSDNGTNQPFGFVDAVLHWDPTKLQLNAKINNNAYNWTVSDFPNDSELDGLNEPFTGPSPFLPANDGDAFYQASRAFEPNPPPIATPQGLLIVTFRFRAIMNCGPSSLVLAATGGPNTESRVLDSEVPGFVITGTLGPPSVVEVSCSDTLFCNGLETCSNNACVSGTPPCFGQTPYCSEPTDTCAECLNDFQCDDGVFCNGVEHCISGICNAGSDPCPGKFCNETTNVCFECFSVAECDDGVDCTLDICNNGQCINFTDHSICDDGIFCNGPEYCHPVNDCTSTGNPCHDPDSCNETRLTCGYCPGPTVTAVGPRYFTVTAQPGVNPILMLVTGDATDETISCLSQYIQPSGLLGDIPFMQTPDQWATTIVTDLDVRPRTKYRICTTCEDGRYSDITEITTWRYGDGNNTGTVTLDDVLCMLNGFSGTFGDPPVNCTLYGVDLQGPSCVPNKVISIDDILGVLNAFSGQTTLPPNCPDTCTVP